MRLQNPQASPAAWAGMVALQQAVNGLGLDPDIYELVKLRASQINGCAFCIDMHFRDGLARGERPERLYLLDAWEEVDVYTPRERAALRWTEALTRLAGQPVPDEIYAAVRAEFTEAELLNLTLGIIAINGWNRFNVGFRVPPRAEIFPVSKKPARPAASPASPATATAAA
jgi:AhpD family alkylhydroperoxidase